VRFEGAWHVGRWRPRTGWLGRQDSKPCIPHCALPTSEVAGRHVSTFQNNRHSPSANSTSTAATANDRGRECARMRHGPMRQSQMLKDSSVAPAPPIGQELREEAHGSRAPAPVEVSGILCGAGVARTLFPRVGHTQNTGNSDVVGVYRHGKPTRKQKREGAGVPQQRGVLQKKSSIGHRPCC
jgi:hypothetical protein